VKNILIVDDERSFLLSLKDGLRAHAQQLNVLLAGDGREAVEIMTQMPVDLLVTDLKLPVMDGFELLAHVSRTSANLPIIVMTAFGTPEMESRIFGLGALTYLEKPLDLAVLEKSIFDALETGVRSYLRGITLAAFLQLVQMEKKTCSLRVRCRGRVAYLFVHQGELIDAECGALRGKEAAFEAIGWEGTEIEMDGICRRKERKIEAKMEFLLMEAFRLKDEQGAPESPSQETGEDWFTCLADNQESAPEGISNPLEAALSRGKRLLQILQSSESVHQYVIFDAHHFPEIHYPEGCSLLHLSTSLFLEAARSIGEELEAGRLKFFLISTRGLIRYLIFRQGGSQVAVAMKPGVRPQELMDELAQLVL
jgi:CheY-like chemotaxis protein